jgi:hypothetical protein
MEVTEFLSHLHRGGEWAYLWRLKDKKSRWFKAGGAIPPRETDRDYYFGVHPAGAIPPTDTEGKPTKPCNVRSRIAYIAAINCLFAEFDVKDLGSKDAIREHLEAKAALWPTVIIDSGGGWHCYWLLNDPHIIADEAQRADAARLQARFVKAVGSDEGAKDLARVLRLPGTLNGKYEPARKVEVIEDNRATAIYTLDELREWVGILMPAPAVEQIIEQAIKHTTPATMGQAGESIITRYNADNAIEATLSRYGYTVKGSKFTRPGKAAAAGISGTIKDGRAYTFSSSDVMFDASTDANGERHAFDAFDLFCEHEHAGDASAACKALLDIYPPAPDPSTPIGWFNSTVTLEKISQALNVNITHNAKGYRASAFDVFTETLFAGDAKAAVKALHQQRKAAEVAK